MNKRHFIALLAALAMPAAFAGMYDQPYALVESGAQSDTRKEHGLAITKVDGQSLRNTRKSEPIAPGRHMITVELAGKPRDIEVDLVACTRYSIVATYSGLDWKPKIYSEPIGECVKKFKK